jgi:RNA polymerase sigma-70 factor (ECF subfamily)
MHSKLEEDDLVEIQRGNHAALKRAWESHADFVFFIAGKYLANRESREDVVQEVFIKLANGAGTIKDSKSLRGWLAVTTRNACIDAIRRSHRQIPVEPADLVEMAAEGQAPGFNAGGSDDPVQMAEREAELALVGHLMDEVASEPGGDTLALFYRQGLPVAEIARRRGESVGTVTSRLTRLRERLRARILARGGTREDGNG